MHRELVIVGNGPAAWAAAAEWTRLKRSRPVVIAPNWPAVSLPGLSQVGNGRVADAAWKHEREWPADVLAGLVERVDAESGQITWRNLFARSFSMTFGQVVVATGTRPRSWIQRSPHPRVLRLHEAADLKGWAQLRAGQRLVVVGGGLVGAEMVEMGVARGCEVEWWVREERLWPEVLSAAGSALLLTAVAGHGVAVKFNQTSAPGKAMDADVVGVAIGTEAVLPEIRGMSSDRLAIAGDAAGLGSGWAYAGASGQEAVRKLCGLPIEPRAAGDFPFRASVFDEKVCAWGQRAGAASLRFEASVGRLHVEWSESEAGELLGLATINVPLKDKWVQNALGRKSFELSSLLEAVADPHLRAAARRMILQTPVPC